MLKNRIEIILSNLDQLPSLAQDTARYEYPPVGQTVYVGA